MGTPPSPADRPDPSADATGVWIHAIATANPDTVLSQDAVRDLVLGGGTRPRLTQRLVSGAFASSGIETRHLAVAGLDGGMTMQSPFLDPDDALTPRTTERNALAVAHGRVLAAEAGRDALAQAQFDASSVTHVISVSCTGLSAPGVDQGLVRDLGLRSSVRRLHIGFMGCYAAFPAWSAARSICRAEPDAVVLVVCVEVCSVHLHVTDDPDDIVASSLFGDGAAAMIVSSRTPTTAAPTLRLDTMETVLTSTGESDLTWTIGEHGFDMVLSTYVPKIIEAEIAGALEPLSASDAAHPSWADVPHWAVHPGGPAILDRVERALDLTDDQLAASRDVLRHYGNMSSATVPFILREVLDGTGVRDGDRVGALAFGPGLTVESALMTVRMGR